MQIKKLTDTALKSLKPKEQPYKISDGTIGGLYVAVSPTGKKVFRLAYKFQGKAQLLTLGSYPEFTLAEAREAAQEAKKQLAHGQSPAALKKSAKAQAQTGTITFRHIAQQWLALRKPEWSEVHWEDMDQKLNLHVLPFIGDSPMVEITKAEVKAILDSLQAQEKFETLKRTRSIISQVFQHALDSEVPGVIVDWTTQLRRQYSSPPAKNRAALTTPQAVGKLMRSIEGYKAVSLQTALALKFSALTFCRPGEIRHAEWAEIDEANTLWRIPPTKMKGKQTHLVPLATQTLALLDQLRPMSGHGQYLFPSSRSISKPMSEMTITAALRYLGYTQEEMCAHGFRGMASTLLNEKGFNRDWIERQLSHGPKDKVRAAYNHTDFLEDRRKMMQWWADFLEDLSAKGE